MYPRWNQNFQAANPKLPERTETGPKRKESTFVLQRAKTNHSGSSLKVLLPVNQKKKGQEEKKNVSYFNWTAIRQWNTQMASVGLSKRNSLLLSTRPRLQQWPKRLCLSLSSARQSDKSGGGVIDNNGI